MTRRPRVAILGGGMAGMATAWRLSEPGSREQFESITIYQRGWRLGGKGASSRGRHGRIEEHGLHVWLGYYENAFRLLRECYGELDRAVTDPAAPIRTWRDAIIPAPDVGVEDFDDGAWRHWVARFAVDDELPGDPDAPGGVMTVAEFVRRAVHLLQDFARSLPDISGGSGQASGQVTDALRRTRHLVSILTATVRGIVADGLLVDPRGFGKINDEASLAWLRRHGAAPEAIDASWVRGLHDLVFASEDADSERAPFAAGWGVFLAGKLLFDYTGALFWKMTAGMGDVVFAPLYQALRQRGVDFALFHRVDQLHLSPSRLTIDAISVGVQARLAEGVERYEPLVRVRGLPCFPAAPLGAQLADADGIEAHDLESHGCDWPDAGELLLRRGEDFDVAVYAIPVGMASIVCRELIADRQDWREMVGNVRTVATQAFQLWLREDERSLGWDRPGSTLTGYVKPFDTWASMPQVVEAEDWPPGERPRTIAYFCGTLADRPGEPRERVRANAVRFMSEELGHLLPGAVRDGDFRWDLLCGRNGQTGPAALDSQYWVANVDPSDRYVQSAPGTDRYRLRPDESGYDNLYLAGDWTDCGLNAGCIEAAVLSGLQAANAVLGRSRHHRIAGYYLL